MNLILTSLLIAEQGTRSVESLREVANSLSLRTTELHIKVSYDILLDRFRNF